MANLFSSSSSSYSSFSFFFGKTFRLEKAVDEIFLRQKQNGSRLIDICKYFYDNVEEDRSKGSMYANYISRGRANIYKKILNLPC